MSAERLRPRVVIVGAGFGGLETAKKLAKQPVDVVVIDQHNYHLFTPLLYQVASSLLNPSEIAQSVRAILRGQKNFRFVQGQVEGVDFERHAVRLSGEDEMLYDYLVIATGSTTNFFGLEGAEQLAQGLKDLPEALALRNHILSCLETASHKPAEAEDAGWLTFTVAGGGPTGVEYAGALSELVRGVVHREYPELDGRNVRIVLVEGRDEVLPPFRPKLGGAARRALQKKGVEVITGQRVVAVSPESVTLAGGQVIATRTLVWAAGVKPGSLAAALGVPLTKSGRIEVDEYLRLPGRADVFAIGDVAAARRDDGEVPMLSAPAMQEGRLVAKNIARAMKGEALKPFHYFDKGSMATIGKNSAVAQVGPLNFTGFIGWVVWLVVHLYYIIGFRNRVAVLMNWAWDYVRSDRPIRIIAKAK